MRVFIFIKLVFSYVLLINVGFLPTVFPLLTRFDLGDGEARREAGRHQQDCSRHHHHLHYYYYYYYRHHVSCRHHGNSPVQQHHLQPGALHFPQHHPTRQTGSSGKRQSSAGNRQHHRSQQALFTKASSPCNRRHLEMFDPGDVNLELCIDLTYK